MPLLKDLLTPTDLTRCQRHFAWDIGQVPTEHRQGDGPGGKRGSTTGPLFSSRRTITLDAADVPRGPFGSLLLVDPRALETLLHELVHCDQARRGFWYRLRMLWWNRTRPYEERPHEVEARTQARVWAAS